MSMFDTIVHAVLFLGAVLLLISFFPIKRLVESIPEGPLRKRWSDLRALILFFIAGYASFIYFYWQEQDDRLELLIVPALFFYSAVLVLFIGKLAMETAVEIERVFSLERETVTDHLIGIYNRRYLDERMAQEIRRARRYGLPLSFFLMDIDHFKSINDRYGHPVGDETLKSLGRLLRGQVRNTDIVARYGGEEIAILAIQTPLPDARDEAERIRRAVESVESSVMVPADGRENRPDIAITVSIGATGISEDVTDPQTLIDLADKALYKAKKDATGSWFTTARGDPGRGRPALHEHGHPPPAPLTAR